jgi:hypothetical protein
MSTLFDVIGISRVSRYVSMRMHGTSAQIQSDTPPDNPDKKLSIERIPAGTLITSNFPAHMSVHFAIPTPLTVERTESFLGLATQLSAPVFKGASVRVVHIEIYLTASNVALGTFKAMDGNRKIFQGSMDDLFTLIPSDDPYFEQSPGTFICDLNQRVLTGLGVTFELGFTDAAFGDPEHSRVLLVGAKAIFHS